MILEAGNMWTALPQSDLFLFTGNGTITLGGSLVMGRGMASQVRDRYPKYSQGIGTHIRTHVTQKQGPYFVYHLLVPPMWPERKIGAFQVKYFWKDAADLDLIEQSCQKLYSWYMAHPDRRVDLNFPGIGNGKLDRAHVHALLLKYFASLTELHVWELPPWE